MKQFITIFILSCLAVTAKAQQEAGASAAQATQFSLSDVIEIVFADVNSENGNTIFMPFNNSHDFANGVTVADQELRVRANTEFKVSLKYDMSTFTYVGAEKANAEMLRDALGVMVTSNNTGGQVAAPYSTADYATIGSADRDLLVNGQNGGNQRFAVKYKCQPKQVLPVGNYFINVVYTATKN